MFWHYKCISRKWIILWKQISPIIEKDFFIFSLSTNIWFLLGIYLQKKYSYQLKKTLNYRIIFIYFYSHCCFDHMKQHSLNNELNPKFQTRTFYNLLNKMIKGFVCQILECVLWLKHVVIKPFSSIHAA